MIENVPSLRLFTQVAARGGFTAAARALNLPVARVSRAVAQLERSIGVRLFERSTRNLRLTDFGDRFLVDALQILDLVDAAEAAAQSAVAEPAGLLRVTAPAGFAALHVAPVIAQLSQRHPGLRVAVDVTNHPLDLILEDFDLAIRIGELPRSDLIARKLGIIRTRLFAAPPRAESWGCRGEVDLAALRALPLIGERAKGSGAHRWSLVDKEERAHTISFLPVTLANDAETIAALSALGAGVGRVPDYIARPLVSSGSIVPVCTNWEAPALPLQALYPSRAGATPGLRAFVSLLERRLQARAP